MSPISWFIAGILAFIAILIPRGDKYELTSTLLFIAAFAILVGTTTAYWFKSTKKIAAIPQWYGILNILLLVILAATSTRIPLRMIDEIFMLLTGVFSMWYTIGTHFLDAYTKN
jgi:hypothetical protein